MTIINRTELTRRLALPVPVGGLVINAVRAIVRTMINRRAALKLADMPDYLLKDVGLKRDDIHTALNQDWRDDPTYQLALVAARRRRSMEC